MLCVSVVNPLDDSHRPELNHRATENTEDYDYEQELAACMLAGAPTHRRTDAPTHRRTDAP
ncbi:MAG TPA: hypothetical protein PKW77_13335, partial [Verrucomicrobiota bacterium]|nr:hypothetical protein [Verrucomicrobiota bacterium]